MSVEPRHSPTLPLLSDGEVRRIAERRRVVAFALAGLLLAAWMAFILLVAYAKPTLATEVTPGLSVGLLSGVGMIVGAWLLACVYMLWAERWLDVALAGPGRSRL